MHQCVTNHFSLGALLFPWGSYLLTVRNRFLLSLCYRNTYNVRVDNIKGILMILTDLILEGVEEKCGGFSHESLSQGGSEAVFLRENA